MLSKAGTTQRDDHLRSNQNHGRIGWQRRCGYDRRSLVETAMYRYKTIIGRRLHAAILIMPPVSPDIPLLQLANSLCEADFQDFVRS